jgi:hypothetical protein
MKNQKRNKTKKKLKQGGGAWWCVGACRERPDRLKALPYPKEKQEGAFFLFFF